MLGLYSMSTCKIFFNIWTASDNIVMLTKKKFVGFATDDRCESSERVLVQYLLFPFSSLLPRINL